MMQFVIIDCCFVAQRDDLAPHGCSMMSHLTMATAMFGRTTGQFRSENFSTMEWVVS
jgi:hypothetical protein